MITEGIVTLIIVGVVIWIPGAVVIWIIEGVVLWITEAVVMWIMKGVVIWIKEGVVILINDFNEKNFQPLCLETTKLVTIFPRPPHPPKAKGSNFDKKIKMQRMSPSLL